MKVIDLHENGAVRATLKLPGPIPTIAITGRRSRIAGGRQRRLHQHSPSSQARIDVKKGGEGATIEDMGEVWNARVVGSEGAWIIANTKERIASPFWSPANPTCKNSGTSNTPTAVFCITKTVPSTPSVKPPSHEVGNGVPIKHCRRHGTFLKFTRRRSWPRPQWCHCRRGR